MPHLVPLSFDWDDEALWPATPADGPAGGNLDATRAVRLSLGHTREVVMIEGEAEVPEIDALPAWREAVEPVGRDLVRGGRWAA